MLVLIKKGSKVQRRKMKEVLAGMAGEGPDLTAGQGNCGTTDCNNCGTCGNDNTYKQSYESWFAERVF